uniref:Uncharacterized protein n=1 Tax=Meloidogyne enterolobii TaxID=390850 RepID=A0A6V7W1B0_MELEN|nr:unnamed protein product [Meloidogyne enterolobii]
MVKKKLEQRLLLIKLINTYVKNHQKAYAEWKSTNAVLNNISNSTEQKKTWPPIEIFSTAAVQLLYPNSNASGIGKTFRKNFLQSKSLQIKTLSERARQGLCSDEDFDKTESAADKENGSDDDSDEENEGEAVAKKEKKRRQEAKCDMALLDPTGFAQEQLKKISGIYKDEKNVNKFKHVGTEVLKIVEEIINNYDSFIMNAIIPAKKNKTERDELTADIMREYKKIQAKGANASTSEQSNEILQQLNSIKELLNSMQQSSDSDPAVEPFNEADDTNYNENGEVFVKEEVDMEPSEHDAN